MEFENLLIVTDTTSKKEYGLYYRIVEVEEWIDYGRARLRIFKDKGDASGPEGSTARREENQSGDLFRLNIESGAAAIEGLREGDFPFSSDPGSANYDPEWKEKLKKKFYYLLPPVVDYAYRGGATSEKN